MWPNLKNLSRGLSLSRGGKYGWFHFVFYFSSFKPALNLSRFWRDLRRGSNSLNSAPRYYFRSCLVIMRCQVAVLTARDTTVIAVLQAIHKGLLVQGQLRRQCTLQGQSGRRGAGATCSRALRGSEV